MAGLVGSIKDLVVEHGEVERETKANRMRRGEVSLGNLGGSLVGVEGLVGGSLALVAKCELG